MAIRVYTDYYVACHFYNDTIPPVIRFGPYQNPSDAQALAEALAKAEHKRFSVLERQFEYDETWDPGNTNPPTAP